MCAPRQRFAREPIRFVKVVCTDKVVADVCRRDTDGHVVTQGDFGQCAYATPCEKTANRVRTDEVCAAGVIAYQLVTEMCTRETDGVVLAPGEFGDCR